MKILGFNITRSSPTPPVTRHVSPEMAAWLVGEDSGPRAPMLGNAYEQVVWVYRAINALAEQVANIPFLFSNGERGRENLITSGPLHRFYDRPHPHVNRFQYWELRVLWLMLRGECARIPIFLDQNRDFVLSTGTYLTPPLDIQNNLNPNPPSALAAPRPKRTLHSIVFLDPASLKHVVRANTLVGWRYTTHNSQAPLDSQVFLPEEVWFEKLPNPYDFWRGLSPLFVADLAAKTDFAATAFMRGLIENNAENGLIVRTDAQLSDEQHEQIAAALRRRKRVGTTDKSVVLWGATEIFQPQISSADLQFLENRKFSRAEICAAFGVPEEILTSTDHAKYDVMQGARLNFIENRIGPLCARLEAEEQRTVRTIDPNAVGWFDLDSLPIMQAARRTRLAAAKTGFDMGVPFNELNRVLDLGFKTLPHGDTCYLPTTLQKVGRALPAPPPPTSPVAAISSPCHFQPQNNSAPVGLSAPAAPPPSPQPERDPDPVVRIQNSIDRITHLLKTNPELGAT